MSENNPHQEILARLRNSTAAENLPLPLEIALKAVRTIGEIAEKENLTFAIAGGLAMQLYGFTRATKDVDVNASGILSLESQNELSFGGKSYRIKVENKQVTVDWIVRDDFFTTLYQMALRDALKFGDLPIIAPDWLVILKYAANRPKDILDVRWLLQQNGLVDLKKVEILLTEALGETGAKMPFQEIERLAFEERSRRDTGEKYKPKDNI